MLNQTPKSFETFDQVKHPGMKRKFKRANLSVWFVLLIAVCVMPLCRAQNLVQNSAFEGVNPYIAVLDTVNGYCKTYPVAVWNTNNSNAYVFTPGTTQNNHAVSMDDTTLSGVIPGGGNMMAVDNPASAGNGILSQDISGLITGATYQLDFYYGAFQQHRWTGIDTVAIEASMGADFLGTTPTMTVSSLGEGGYPSAVPWALQSYTFTASSDTETLQFLNIGVGQPAFMALADVSITAVPVPEAGSTLLLAAASGMLCMRRRRC